MKSHPITQFQADPNTSLTIDVSAAPTGMTKVVIRWISVNQAGAAPWQMDVTQGGTTIGEFGGLHNQNYFFFGDCPIVVPISDGDVLLTEAGGTILGITVGYNYI
jgi:hypothetical protein